MTALEIALRIAKHFEGCEKKLPDGRIKSYWDADGGVWTIGWGATGSGISEGTMWTQQQCDDWISKRMAKDLAVIDKKCPGLQPHQLGALASFAYNVGLDDDEDTKAEGLLDSTLFLRCKSGNFLGAATQFERWNKAGGKVMRGLSRRRKCERDIFLGKPLAIIEVS
jgi:lysozyme